MTDGLSEAYETKRWDVFCENNDLLLENDLLKAENAKWRTLCRDMYLVVTLLDMEDMCLRGHGKDADWRTLKERYDELGIEVDE